MNKSQKIEEKTRKKRMLNNENGRAKMQKQ